MEPTGSSDSFDAMRPQLIAPIETGQIEDPERPLLSLALLEGGDQSIGSKSSLRIRIYNGDELPVDPPRIDERKGRQNYDKPFHRNILSRFCPSDGQRCEGNAQADGHAHPNPRIDRFKNLTFLRGDIAVKKADPQIQTGFCEEDSYGASCQKDPSRHPQSAIDAFALYFLSAAEDIFDPVCP
jgi:hypothetical protein